MKELIQFVVENLVDSPDDVSIKEVQSEKGCVYELRVAQDDLGKVIGKQGRTAKAIRTLMNASGTKSGKKAILEIME